MMAAAASAGGAASRGVETFTGVGGGGGAGGGAASRLDHSFDYEHVVSLPEKLFVRKPDGSRATVISAILKALELQ